VIAPNATNEVGQPHTFTVTLLEDTGSGLVPAGAGEPVTVTLTPANGATPSPAGPFNLTTNASGQVSVTFTSPTAGTVTGHASSTLSVGGSAPFTVQTDGVAPNSGDAVKTFVDANIQLSPATDTDAVNDVHTLTGHVNVNPGSGQVNAPAGTQINLAITSGPGALSAASCLTLGGTGSCEVTLTSATTGTTVISANTTVAVGGVSLTRSTNGVSPNSGTAQKSWVDAWIAIAPDDTDPVNDTHTFTVTVKKDPGTGTFVPANGEHVSFSVVDAGGASFALLPATTCGVPGPDTDAAGQCLIVITSPTAGTDTANATVTLVVGGVTLIRDTDPATIPGHGPGGSGPATKTWVANPTGKTLIYPGSMEGHIDFLPGSWVNGGFHFKLTQKNPVPVTVTVTGTIDLPVHCSDAGGAPVAGVISVPVSIAPFTIPANSTSWYLSGDQNNILTWMGAVAAPDLCAGGLMHNREGATFNVVVGSTAHTGAINFQWHYRVPAAKNKPNTNCTDAADPNRNRADVCGASWSATKDP